MAKRRNRIKLWAALTAVCAVLLVILLILTPIANTYSSLIDSTLNVQKSKLVGGDGDADTEYYKSDYSYDESGDSELYADYLEVYEQIAEEGTVLMKNDNGALPLESGDEVIVYDLGSTSPRTTTAASDIHTALSSKSGITSTYKTAYSTSDEADLAIVEITRIGSEGTDPGWGTENGGSANAGGVDQLALTDDEEEIFAQLKESTGIDHVLVLLNLTNSVDCAFMDDVDAVIWSAKSVPDADVFADLLCGDRNFSGRLTDTYYVDNTTNPVMENFGYFAADLSGVTTSYRVEIQKAINQYDASNGDYWSYGYTYQEGIYVGYKYAETRYEDYVLDQYNASSAKGTLDESEAWTYDGYVAAPFGLGLDYTTWEYSGYSVAEEDDSIVVTVTVKNTGSMAGKHSVPVYMQSPYTDYDRANGIEKASVQLVGYTKTDTVKAGEEETVSVEIAKYMLRAYDSTNAKSYIEDAGTYYFTIGESAHDAVNNVLAAKGCTPSNTDGRMDAEGNSSVVGTVTKTFNEDDFSVSYATGYSITNQFDDVDPNEWDAAQDAGNDVTYLSRSDWENTYPEGYNVKYNDEIASYAIPVTYEADEEEQAETEMPTLGASHDLALADMIGKDYDDEDWDLLLEELSWTDMVNYINNGGYQTPALSSVGKPFCSDMNSSTGRSVTLQYSGDTFGGYPNSPMRAATFNTELNYRAGELQGEALMHASVFGSNITLGIYGFSCNIHRSPYSGRNSEYYSEDAVLSGLTVAYEAKGVQDKGGVTYIKHFFMNDCETMRHGVATWGNEQTIREIYTLPFEFATTIGETKAYMNSFNRLGTQWVGQHEGAQIEFLENECGFEGCIVTDQYEAPYQDSVDGLLAGTTLWLTNPNDYYNLMDYEDDPVVVSAVVEAMHKNLYIIANSMAMNGISSSTQVVEVTSWWWVAIIVIDVVVGVATVVMAVFLVLEILKVRKMKKQRRQQNAGPKNNS